MTMAPLFFISHGAPTFALEPGTLGPRLNALGKALSKAPAVLVVSPHWQTRDVRVMTTPTPETIHDFGGFPAALYELQYPAQGQPQLAAEAARLLAEAGFAVGFDDRRGLDHGAWVPLMHLLPAADVPVFQVSMPQSLDTAGAVRMGQALTPLREQGVVILCSGSMTHNLYEFRQGDSDEAVYVGEFKDWVRRVVVAGDVNQMIAYRQNAPHAARAHPTEEHFLPLLVALGARAEGETPQVIEAETTYGVISMESYLWG
jgi:4,5-DOPA dioxygenase extradiol